MTSMIPRNTTIPTQKKEIFSTAADNQPSVEIHVLQGERAEARYNRTLGKFHLEGILPAPRGVPKVEVTFDIDANGILNVSAKDLATGKDVQKRIEGASGLNEQEIQKMVKEAAEHEAEDKARREVVDRRNKLDAMVYQLEKTISEAKDKLPADDVTKLEEALKEARQAVERQDDDAIKAATAKLEKESHRIAEQMYKSAGGPPSGGAPPGGDGGPSAGPTEGGGEKKKEGVIDAEFEESN
jgi:molecular chaperone DnaK